MIIIWIANNVYINRFESQDGYDANDFKIQVHSQDRHVVTPAEFMNGCVKRLVGMIRTIEPVRLQLYFWILYT